jgi:hypothetical protein
MPYIIDDRKKSLKIPKGNQALIFLEITSTFTTLMNKVQSNLPMWSPLLSSHLYIRSPLSSPVKENFIWIASLLRDKGDCRFQFWRQRETCILNWLVLLVDIFVMKESTSMLSKTCTVKPVLRGHLYLLKERQFIHMRSKDVVFNL